MSAMYPLVHGIMAQAGLSPPGPAWALYLMDEGAGQTLYDQSGNGRDMWLGTSGVVGPDDPAWVTVGGVACLEFAGSQVCYSKTAATLSQPFTMLSIVRSTSNNYQMIVQTENVATFRGLLFRSNWQVGMNTGATLADNYAPGSTWAGLVGVANGANSAVWYHGGTPTVGNAGVNAITRLMLGAFLATGIPYSGLVGQLAAAAVLEGAASQEYATAWLAYMANMKGVTL